MKLSPIIILVVIFAIECTTETRKNVYPIPKGISDENQSIMNTRPDAEKIIAHAINLCEYIDNIPVREGMLKALHSMVIYYDTSATHTIDIANNDQFVLLISTEKEMTSKDSKESQLTLFIFDDEHADKTGNFVIRMSKEVPKKIHDEDAKACMLLHEIVHAMQENNLALAGKKTQRSSQREREVEALKFESDLYFKIHPKQLTAKCDCENFKVVKYPIGIYESDSVNCDLLLFYFCQEKYLEEAYGFSP